MSRTLDRPLVSAIMAAYNGEKYIEEAVESVFAQTYPNIELIVADDGSTDSTPEILKSYGDRLTYVWQENQGPAAARNLAISHATGEFVAVLDADDVWCPRKTLVQMQLFEIDPSIALVFGQQFDIDEAGNSLGTVWPEALPAVVKAHSINGLPRTFRIGHDLFEGFLTGCFLSQPSVIVRKSALTSVDGYDKSLRQSEDWDLWLRLAAEGMVFGFVREPVFARRHHGASLTHKLLTAAWWDRAVIEKHLSNASKADSELQHRLRKSAAGAAKKFGDYLAAAGRLTEARREYSEAMRYAFRPIYPLSWAATFLGPTGLRLLKMLNHGSDIFDSGCPGMRG